MTKRTQETNNDQAAEADFTGAPGLDDLIQQGARRIIQQAIEAELTAMLEQYSNVKTIDGRRPVVRNGYLPEREIVTAVGPVPVQVPKVRDRSGSGIKFNSAIVPALRTQISARVVVAAVAVPARCVHRRHGQS